MTSKYKVIVTQRFFDAETIEYLNDHDCGVEVVALPPGKGDGDLLPADLARHLREADGWIVGHAYVTRDLLAACPKLQIVARRGVGYERVDLAAAEELKRVVTIAAGGNAASVADLTIGLMIGVGRHLAESNRQMRSGKWAIIPGTELYKKTVGVIGLGRIGRQVVERLQGFQANILVHAPRPDIEFLASRNGEFADLETIYRESDYITLHAPLTPDTSNLINQASLALMKPGAIIINTARSDLVDEAALLDALVNGRIAGAGLDVLRVEGDPAAREIADRLLALPNVLTTPHAAASTAEGLQRTNRIAAETIVAVLQGRNPASECIVADGRR